MRVTGYEVDRLLPGRKVACVCKAGLDRLHAQRRVVGKDVSNGQAVREFVQHEVDRDACPRDRGV